MRSPRAWVSLVLGVVLVGAGLGLMIDADLGVSPADAFITGRSPPILSIPGMSRY